MKTSFRKVVSVLLSVLMLVSFCTVAFAETTEAPKPQDFGLYSGSGIGSYVADPAGSGETVIKAEKAHGRFNYRLADPADLSKPFVVEAGKYYTITFDYLVNSTSTGNIGFDPYYGLKDSGNAADGTAGRKAVADFVCSGFSKKFIGDGKWHTAAVSFLANPTEIKVEEEVVETLNNIYMTFFDDKGIDGYFKNFTIVEETDATGLYVDRYTTDMKAHIGQSGTTYGSAMTYTAAEGTGNLILSNGNTSGFATGNSGKWVKHRAIINSNKSAYRIVPGITYTINLNYRVVNNPGWVTVGIGYAKSGVMNTGDSSVIAQAIKHTTTTEWQTLTAVFSPSLNSGVASAVPRIILSSSTAAGAIEIESIEILGTGMPNAPIVTYYDNGKVEKRVDYIGASIIVEPDNGYLGEESEGWCTDTALTTLTDKVPASANLYAQYDAVVIDNFNMKKLVKAWDYSDVATLNKGSVTVTNSSGMAFVLPAYDAPATGGSGGYDYYQFVNGSEYIVIIDFADVTESAVKDPSNSAVRNLTIMGATSAGQSGGRDTKIDVGATPAFTTSADEAVSGTAVYHFTRAAGSKGWETCAMGVRSSNDDHKYTATIEKIIITKVDENTPFAAIYTPSAEANYTFAATGTQVELPATADTDTHLFAGYYIDRAKISDSAKHTINTDDIALPGNTFIAKEGGFFQYNAKLVAKGSMTVDFSEAIYGTLANGTDLGGTKGQTKVVVDETIDTEALSSDNTYLRLYTTSNNIYKTSLFKDDDSRIRVFENVTYKFDIRYKVVTPAPADSRTGGTIAMCRNPIGDYSPTGLNGSGASTPMFDITSATETFVTASETFKVENMYRIESATDRNYKSQLAVMIPVGDVYVDYIIVTPVSYDPTYITYDETKGSVDVDYLNGTLTVTPNEGYEIAANGVKVQMNYKDYIDSKAVSYSAMNIAINTEDGLTYSFSTDYPDFDKKIGAFKITVNFVEIGNLEKPNANFLAVSRREVGTDTDGKYQSAGIRFRSRFSASTVNAATEIGFVILPKVLLDNAGVKTVGAYKDAVAAGTVPTDRSVSGVVYNAADETHVIYKQLNGYYDYQAVLTGLTSADGKTDLTSLDMSIAAYIKDAEGNVTYLELGTAYSHSDIPAASN